MEKVITFIVTKTCQLKCKYCYLVGKNNSGQMSWAIAQKAIDYILDNKRLFPEDSVVFDFTGGEPLLNIALIDTITSYVLKCLREKNHPWLHNCSFRITTNGLLYADKKVQNYIRKYQSYLRISISIDGTRQKNDTNRIFPNGEGSYDKIIKNIPLWLKQFPNSVTRMTISSIDAPYIYESAVHLISLGIKNIDISTVVEDVWRDGDEKVVEDELLKLADYLIEHDLWKRIYISSFEKNIGHPQNVEDIATPCGGMTLSIDSQGNFFPCMRFAKYSLRTKKERSIGSIYTGIDKNRIRPLMAIDYQTINIRQCSKCEIATGCKWCPAENYDSSDTGTIFQRTTTICKIHRAKVRAKYYFYKKLESRYGEY